MNVWIAKHGVPKVILSDQDKDFVSNIVRHLCQWLGVKKIQSSSYYAQTNGTVERWNRTLGAALRAISLDKNLRFTDGDAWDIFIPMIAANHNNKHSQRIGMSPNRLETGKDLRLPIDFNMRMVDINPSDDGYDFYSQYVANLRNIAEGIAKAKLDVYDE